VEAVNRYRTVHHSTKPGLTRPAEGGPVLVEWVLDCIHDGASLGDLSRALREGHPPEPPIPTLAIERGPARYEHLRDGIESATKSRGLRPAVFLAVMGPLKQYKPRADFSRTFFETAGFHVILPPAGFSTPEEAARAALASHAPVVVICSTDETYPALVPPLAATLKKRPSHPVVVLAGRPEDQVDMLQKAGVDEFIHVRANALETLERIARRAGVLS
jgi:methylmalonyl-CoA mutase